MPFCPYTSMLFEKSMNVILCSYSWSELKGVDKQQTALALKAMSQRAGDKGSGLQIVVYLDTQRTTPTLHHVHLVNVSSKCS